MDGSSFVCGLACGIGALVLGVGMAIWALVDWGHASDDLLRKQRELEGQ